MKKVVILLSVIILPIFSISAKEPKIIQIGYVDIQKVMNNYSKGKQAIQYLQSLKDSYESKKKNMEDEIKKIEKELETKSKDLNETQLRDYLTTIETKRQELEIFTKNANADLKNKETSMLKPLYEKILETLKKIAQEQGYNLVIDSKYVLIADPDLDLTDPLIKALEANP
ncbi:MAG TPA: OmpH family outer membrane protein [Spirochaetota bacterium]|nr:OmpH family outer membrane protein [Spirochaetota bacterium]HOM37970.1 OmpH family outer membrane protein [Spirochaetota bacterium]HPQ48775.1 OmpH family outer membrane protein [Spirochaetota bacterium]